MTVDELVDAGLCWGWISGQRRSFDDTFYLQKYVRRRPRSLWSQVNVDKVAALTAAGRMRPAGQAEVDAAISDGRWAAAYESQKNATTPPDLESALAANPGARQRFDFLTKSQRYSIIHPLLTAKTEKTRANRLAKAIATLSPNETNIGSAHRSYESPL
ncbi:YdeI/OmpD-associated family protein [Acrocarpospora pleiomorpha]|uniref:YdeI/OmpD-associated family protein n=1 Tax=Acrocarpospora pleiomorpha TaxID=90975 RepID=UPI0031DCFE41